MRNRTSAVSGVIGTICTGLSAVVIAVASIVGANAGCDRKVTVRRVFSQDSEIFAIPRRREVMTRRGSAHGRCRGRRGAAPRGSAFDDPVDDRANARSRSSFSTTASCGARPRAAAYRRSSAASAGGARAVSPRARRSRSLRSKRPAPRRARAPTISSSACRHRDGSAPARRPSAPTPPGGFQQGQQHAGDAHAAAPHARRRVDDHVFEHPSQLGQNRFDAGPIRQADDAQVMRGQEGDVERVYAPLDPRPCVLSSPAASCGKRRSTSRSVGSAPTRHTVVPTTAAKRDASSTAIPRRAAPRRVFVIPTHTPSGVPRSVTPYRAPPRLRASSSMTSTDTEPFPQPFARGVTHVTSPERDDKTPRRGRPGRRLGKGRSHRRARSGAVSLASSAVSVGAPCVSPGADRPGDGEVDFPLPYASPLRSRFGFPTYRRCQCGATARSAGVGAGCHEVGEEVEQRGAIDLRLIDQRVRRPPRRPPPAASGRRSTRVLPSTTSAMQSASCTARVSGSRSRRRRDGRARHR